VKHSFHRQARESSRDAVNCCDSKSKQNHQPLRQARHVVGGRTPIHF